MSGTCVLQVPRHGLSTSVDPAYELDVAGVFGRDAPLVVEIGSGRGEALVHAAALDREHDFLGLEVYTPGVAQTLVTMQHVGVSNVRLVVVNAAEALATMLPPGSARELRMWFPDPWHKVRHRKRRLVDPPFARLAARVLEPGGRWCLATDWRDYAEQIRQVLAASPDFDADTAAPRFDGRPVTRFESRAIAEGRAVFELSAVRRTHSRMNG